MSIVPSVPAKKAIPKRNSRGANTRHKLKDRKNDLNETPPEATLALIEHADLPDAIWEPCCGPGAMVSVLRAAGHIVYATDLVDYKSPLQDMHGWDFLLERQLPIGTKAIVMNPPYKLDSLFIAHALRLCPRVFALLRLNFLEAGNRMDEAGQARRYALDEGMLEHVYVFRNRLPMMHREGWTGNRTGSSIAFAWFEWDAGRDPSAPWSGSRIMWKRIPGKVYERESRADDSGE